MRKPSILLLALLPCGCSDRGPSTVGTSVTAPHDHVSDAALLWNGLIGIRVGPDGDDVQGPGKLPLFMIDSYTQDAEEKIQPLESPLKIPLVIDGAPVRLSQAKNYVAHLDMRQGVLKLRGTVSGVTVTCETVVHPTARILAQRWTATPSGGHKFEFPVSHPSVPSTKGSVEGKDVSYFDPKGDRQLDMRLRTDTSGGQRYSAEAIWSWGESSQASRFRYPGVPRSYRMVIEVPYSPPTYDEVAQASAKAWAKRWETDIEIDGPAEDQEAVRSFLFYLQSSISPKGNMAIAPFGLSNAAYFGHVFWDADIWVSPALALIDPESAAAIAMYRIARVPGAQANYKAWLAANRPVADGTSLGPASAANALMYPWESSVTGKESLPGEWGKSSAGPSRHEAHITGSVVWGLEQAVALGLAPAGEVDRIGRMAAEYYLQRLRKRPDGRYEMASVMSPDENHKGNNDLYTNLLAKHVIDRYLESRFPNGIDVVLPRDAQSFLSYDDDPLRTYKQAAAILSIYPLQYPPAERKAAAMMERFAPKVIPNGPAMSDSIDAIIWARTGSADQAYDAWRRSWKEFVQPPFMLFAEKRSNGRTYFTTGAAGSLQTVIYGFLGFRIDSQKDPAASWAKKLSGERWLTIRPNLPTVWRSVKFKNFTILGQRYTLIATHGGLKVTQGD